MAENGKPKNGLRKLALLAPVVVAGLALLIFWRDLFPSKVETSGTGLKLEAFQREFAEYKQSHDKWAVVQIQLFRGDIDELKVEIMALKQEVKELRKELEHRRMR